MTQEEQIQAAIEDFFADKPHKEQEKAIVTEFIMGSDVIAIINESGELVPNYDPSELKGKKILVMGNHSAGLTQSLLAEVGAPQKFAQTHESFLEVSPNKKPDKPPKMEIKLEPLIIHTPIYDTSSTKKRYNRRGKNNKYF